MSRSFLQLSITQKRRNELEIRQEKRIRLGYPKVGISIKAIKSGNPSDLEGKVVGRVEKENYYMVIDNIDCFDGYFHIRGEGICIIRLTPKILKEFFGIELRMNPSLR